MIKNSKFIFSFLLGSIFFAGVALAAPYYQNTQTLIPFVNNAWDLGTSTSVYRNLYITQVCLSADCKTSWPAGSTFGTTSISATSPLLWNSSTANVSIPQASSTVAGYLDDYDYARFLNGRSTSWLSGGNIAINADPTKFDVSAGTGVIIDNVTDILHPTHVHVSFGPFTGVSATRIGTDIGSRIWIDGTGAIQQTSLSLNPVLLHTQFPIGVLSHQGSTIGLVTQSAGVIDTNIAANLAGLGRAIGPITTGATFSANGVNLKIDLAAGETFLLGAYKDNLNNPNTITTLATTSKTFITSFRDGAGGQTVSTSTTLNIVPGVYDNNTAGGVYLPNGTVPNNKFTAQKISLFTNSGLTVVEYGQKLYASIAEAQSLINSDAFTSNPNIASAGGSPREWLIVRGNATNLSDPTQAVFVPIIGIGGGSGAVTSATTNMQQSYDNSVAPQIVTDTTRGSVQYKRGSAADMDAVLQILNGAGNAVVNLFGTGYASTTALSAYTAKFGATATSTFTSVGWLGVGTTSPWRSLSVNGSSDLGTNALAGYFTSTTTATSTFAGGISTNLLNVTSATASSTFANGINLVTGCLAYNGTCVATGAGTVTSVATDSTLTGGPITTTGTLGLNLANANWWTGLQNFALASTSQFTATSSVYLATTGGNVGVGTTSPTAKLSVHARATETNSLLFAVASSTATATTTLFSADNRGQLINNNTIKGLTGVISPVRNLRLGTATTTAWTATSSVNLITGVMPFAGTIRSALCSTDAGTLNVDLYHTTTHLALINASTTIGTFSFTANNTFTSGEILYMVAGTPVSSPTRATCTLNITETAI